MRGGTSCGVPYNDLVKCVKQFVEISLECEPGESNPAHKSLIRRRSTTGEMTRSRSIALSGESVKPGVLPLGLDIVGVVPIGLSNL